MELRTVSEIRKRYDGARWVIENNVGKALMIKNVHDAKREVKLLAWVLQIHICEKCVSEQTDHDVQYYNELCRRCFVGEYGEDLIEQVEGISETKVEGI